MPDPALLALVKYSSSPPALMEPAIVADAEPFLSAYEAIADQHDREFDAWAAEAAKVEEKARAAVEARPHEFPPQIFEQLLQVIDQHIRRGKRVIARMERPSTSQTSARMRQLRERSLTRQRRQHAAACELAMFLNEMRAEIVARQAEGPAMTWTPNETTAAAMREAEAGGLPRFATVADLMADLHADD